MHKRATVQEIILPHATTVTPNEGTEGRAIPAHEFPMVALRGNASVARLPSHRGIAPWDALWARSHATRH